MKPITTFFIRSPEEVTSSFKHHFDKMVPSGLPLPFYQDCLLAFTEGVANAITHARELEKFSKIKITFSKSLRGVKLTVTDHGAGFDLKKCGVPSFDGVAESGRGVFLMRQLMDRVGYQKNKKGNILVLERDFPLTDKKNSDLDLVYEISDVFLSSGDFSSIGKSILEKTARVFDVERASLLIFNRETKKLEMVASIGFPKNVDKKVEIRPGAGISGFVFQHAKPCLIEDIENNNSGWEASKNYKSRSFISAPMIASPMKVGQETVGVINLTERKNGKPFSKQDLKLLSTIANQASAYFHMYQLMKKVKETELLKKEFEIARHIQQSFLPEKSPQINGLDIASLCETAMDVGGDYYDFVVDEDSGRGTLQRAPTRLCLVLADVSGHNVGAAMSMVNFRSCFKTLLQTVKTPDGILTEANLLLFDDLSKNDQFISVLIACVDLKKKEVTLSSAGHPWPLVFKNGKSGFIENPKKIGCVLGVKKDEVYEKVVVKLSKNEAFLFTTDGLPELKNKNDELLGWKKVESIFEKLAPKKAAEIVAGFKKEIDVYKNGTELADDLTMVVMKVP